MKRVDRKADLADGGADDLPRIASPPMTRWLRRGGAALLWIVVAVCLTLMIVPRYLDRIYYRGPVSGHFDGAHFFNPDGEDAIRITPRLLWRQLVNDPDRPAWPARVAVTPSKPPARVEGGAMLATWVGHATLLVQADGVNILTDPVWSDTAGPFGMGPRRFAEPGIRFEDLPKIDLVLVSHNHYDHMDLATLQRIWRRDRPVIVTSLGNDKVIGAGVPTFAVDWGASVALTDRGGEIEDGVPRCDPVTRCPQDRAVVTVTRNHHWDSRWFSDRNRALWSSFVVALPHGNFFFSGDTGLGDGKWPAEAAALGPIRFAAIPIGAFRFEPGEMGIGSHIGPEGAIRVWDGLGRPQAIPIHWGTFRLSREGYATPPRMLAGMLRCGGEDPRRFAAVRIGQPVAVAPLGTPPPAPDFAAIAACERDGRFAALR
jgi:L-ascorbate metabolism protein UlaG (beta-lactamase superfamily)